ncbi:MAG: S-layer homology domain-containing protein [Firmicutes bacterium]|nr:S-layer homology domain-containing protein [Bacillota bacterium]
MDYSAANTGLWNFVIQIGIIAALLLLSNCLRKKLSFIRKVMIPTAVLAGFLLLLLRTAGILPVDVDFLNMLTYHGIAIGFIAQSLRINKTQGQEDRSGLKSGALIVSTYLMQGTAGLIISLGLCFTFMKDFFPAAGILLPMGYGQGPGQANNIGYTYETHGFAGGQSFGLSLAAAGYLCACIIGVLYLNYLSRKGKVARLGVRQESFSDGAVTTAETFQDENEAPLSDSLDRLSMQICLIFAVYFATYLVSWGLCELLRAVAPGLLGTVESLLWGFNFIIGSVLAMALNGILKLLNAKKIVRRQYRNNYLLSRISGFAFDLMIVAGIATIDIEKLEGLWVPFLLMAVTGGILTLVYLQFMCKKLFPNSYYENLMGFYGMLTGTISSGVLLLRELDPEMKSPAGMNLVTGSSFGIAFGAPMLILVGMAPKSLSMTLLVFGLILVYWALLLLYLLKFSGRKKAK